MVGNVYLGKVQNVLPSMEAAFVDVGRGRNAVLYAGEVNWDAAGPGGQRPLDRAGAEVRRLGAGAGHQGPDRPQGRPADQPRRAVRPPPGLRARRLDDRHQPQAARHRAHSGCGTSSRSSSPTAPASSCAPPPRAPARTSCARDVERLQAQWEDIQKKAGRRRRAGAALRRAGPGHPGGPRPVQRGLPELVVQGDDA